MKKINKYLKTVAIVLGLGIIGACLHSIILGNWAFFGKSIALLSKTLVYCIPFLLKLMVWSLAFIWPPIIIYVLISFITVSKIWRFFLGTVALCGFILIIQHFFVPNLTIKNFYYIFMYMMQIYLLALWIIPKEVWNITSGFFWMIGSVIITIFPDLPTYFDDLGMIFGLFTFIFIYLHTVALFIQRVVDVKIIEKVRSFYSSRFGGLETKTNITEISDEDIISID